MDFERFIDRLYDSFETGKPIKGALLTDILNVNNGAAYWREVLLEKVVRIFEWNGLPFEQKNIELPTLINGYSGFTNDSLYGYVATIGGLSGVTPFPDVFTDFTYAAPKCEGGTKSIYPYNKYGSVVIINNTTLRTSIVPLITQYAALLAHAVATIKCALIDARYTNYMIADSDATRESMIAWRNKTVNGEVTPILNKSLTTESPIVPLSADRGDTMLRACEVRDEILRMFYSDIGIRKNKDKRGNMVTDEVTQNDMSLLFNVSDMLKQRQAAAEQISNLFGLKVSVKLSDEYSEILKGDNYDGDN